MREKDNVREWKERKRINKRTEEELKRMTERKRPQ